MQKCRVTSVGKYLLAGEDGEDKSCEIEDVADQDPVCDLTSHAGWGGGMLQMCTSKVSTNTIVMNISISNICHYTSDGLSTPSF